MSMADKKTVVVSGGNGGKLVPEPASIPDELERARDIARRYRCEFIDLSDFQLHHDLFEKIPVHLMFRYNFVPLDETEDGRLAIAIADPSQLMMIDEISLLLGKRIVTKVSTLKQISDILKKTTVQARAGRCERRIHARRDPRGRSRERRNHLHRQVDGDRGPGHEPDHPLSRYHDFHGVAAACKRHPHRNPGRLGVHQVSY